jgi:hypothetical protein
MAQVRSGAGHPRGIEERERGGGLSKEGTREEIDKYTQAIQATAGTQEQQESDKDDGESLDRCKTEKSKEVRKNTSGKEEKCERYEIETHTRHHHPVDMCAHNGPCVLERSFVRSRHQPTPPTVCRCRASIWVSVTKLLPHFYAENSSAPSRFF